MTASLRTRLAGVISLEFALGVPTLLVFSSLAMGCGTSTTDPPATGGEATFSLTMDPPRLTIARGITDTATIRIARTRFTSAVNLSVSGSPAGVTATILPATASLDTALLISAVNSTAAPGVYALTITATPLTRTATMELTVPAAGQSTQWAQISAGTNVGGNQTVCGVTTTGVGYCWGVSDAMGNGAAPGVPYSRPTLMSGGVTWADIQVGANHACGISTGGDAYCWGDGSSGQLGNGGTNRSSIAAAVAGGRKWRQLSPGSFYTCGVTTSGDLYCWGKPTLAGHPIQSTPLLVPGGRSWASVSAGDPEACGITTGGDLYCWRGFVGVAPPALSPGGQKWRAVEVEFNYKCGITMDGTAMCMGSGASGQLGNGDFLDRTAWTAVAGSRSWSMITGGLYLTLGAHTCAMTPVGEGFCWGAGGTGQLGTGGTSTQGAPVPISGGFVWARLTAGASGYTCGITTARAAYCWGYPGPHLGNGTPLQYYIPTRVIEP
jgi:hypothetical protein